MLNRLKKGISATFVLVAVFCAALLTSLHASGQDSPKVERAKQVMRKAQAGEPLTPDEHTFLEQVLADIRRRRGQSRAPVPRVGPVERGATLPGGWEELSDGSLGQETEFIGVGGIAIPAYVRRPQSEGPFPVIVLLHGGKYSRGATMGMGRSMQSPVSDFINAGWAVYSIDYRPVEKIAIVPIEFDDSVKAVNTVRKLPFIDPTRVGLMGGSHGAQVSSRLVSRVDVSGAVLCAPAAIDLIEVKKAAGRGEPVVSILHKMIADMEAERGAPAEKIEKDPAKYGYSSAMTEVADVRAPILVVNGRNDDNSPTSVIDAYVAKLQAADKQVRTYLPDNGPHGFYFGRPDIPETKEAAAKMVAFFQKQFAQAAAPAAVSTAPSPAGQTKYLYGGGEMDWVDSDRSDAGNLKFKIFHSATTGGDVSYMIWFPPDYDADQAARYPVLYELPASGGSPRKNTPNVVRRVEKAIFAQRIAPMIIVGVPALRGNTMYCDSRDGDYPLETVIIKDLIPHIDATYRTIPSREGRAVDGFSMGGFGAAHLGFKFPEVFGVISIMAPPLLGPELTQPLPTRAWENLFSTAMLNDLEYFRANDPFTLAAKNADALRDRTYIRIVAHHEDENWLVPQCEKLHQVLLQNRIPHEFCVFTNVKGHSPNGCMDSLGDAAFSFFSSSLPKSAAALPSPASHVTGTEAEPPIDVQRGRKLMERSKAGEKLNADDQGYLERVKRAIRQRMSGRQPGARPQTARPSTPANPSDWIGLVPITDMTAPYKGEDGGLYGGGMNEPPEAHRAAHLKESEQIRPLDANGDPSGEGKIGLITIGFSNTSIESEDFKRTADNDPQKSPQVVIVNGAIGGRSAVMWAWDGANVLPEAEQQRLDKEMDVVGMPKENRRSAAGVAKDTWPTLAKRIEAAGLSPLQVQACWLKHVEANPKPLDEFPDHARALQQDMTAILNIAKHHYPNLRVVYLSSRTFGGRSGRASGSPEPYAYESGFGTRWVVQDQISGDAQLNYDSTRGEVRAPLVMWGPYLWAQGDSPRKYDGLTWTQNDVRADRLHPNEAGSRKTTTLLLNFFKTNEGTSRWFLKPGETALAAPLPK